MKFKYKPCAWTRISQYFKEASHKGIDLANVTGTPIYAVADGVVVAAGDSPWDSKGSYGLEVAISHGGGDYTNYAHLSKICVKLNAKVKAGDKIGEMGSTGNSTGPHLHFEYHDGKKWNRVNPKPLIDEAAVVPKGKYNYVVSITSGNLNVRKGPSTSTKSVGKVKKGTQLAVDKVEGSWAHITAPYVGYVAKKYIKHK